jgi:hypothetical protein
MGIWLITLRVVLFDVRDIAWEVDTFIDRINCRRDTKGIKKDVLEFRFHIIF